MRVLVHDFAGHPFQIQLSRSLGKRGHDVRHLYCGKLVTPRGALSARPDDPCTFSISPIETRRAIQKNTYIRRWLQEMAYGWALLNEVRRFSPDVVISANSPLDAQASLIKWCKRNDAQFIYWVQDLIGVGAYRVLSKRFGMAGRVLGAHFRRLEERLLKRSNHVVTITEDFLPTLYRCGVERNRVTVIENWAPLEEVPVRGKNNCWSRRHELEDKRVLLYAGTLGMKHNPRFLVHLAVHFREERDLRVVVISEGAGARWLKRRKWELGLDNLVLMPFQQFEEMPDVLGAADVLLAILENDAGSYCVPSKVLTSLCAGRPLLVAIPSENLAARIVQQSGAGITVAPHDAEGFASGARQLLGSRALREAMSRKARSYAEKHFDIQRITDGFEWLLRDKKAGSAP